MKKRIFAALLALVLVFPMFSAFANQNDSQTVVIEPNEPPAPVTQPLPPSPTLPIGSGDDGVGNGNGAGGSIGGGGGSGGGSGGGIGGNEDDYDYIYLPPIPPTPVQPPPVGQIVFTDVPVGHPAYDAVMYVVSTGLMVGFTPDEFGPDVSLPRSHMAVLMCRVFGIETPNKKPLLFQYRT